MAKQKKNKKNKNHSRSSITPFLEEKDKFLATIQDQLSKQDVKSEGEAQAFLNQFIGRSMENVTAEFDTLDHTEADLAEDLLNQAFEATTIAKKRKLAKQAIETCKTCYQAYDFLASTYSQPAKAREVFLQGINIGYEQFANEINNVPEGENSWLWGHIEARPFLLMLEGKAIYMRENGHIDEAIETYYEILELNHNDNQGVREPLLAALIATDDILGAKEIVSRYPDDSSLGVMIAGVTVTILEELTQIDEEKIHKLEDDINNDNTITVTKMLPKSMKALKQLTERNLFLPLFISRLEVYSLPEPHGSIYKGASEAVMAAQLFAAPWMKLGLPLALLSVTSWEAPKKITPEDQQWLDMMKEEIQNNPFKID
tara:strand:+ start:139 stop:1254 length:1116 start_codon:yes stop_codon:yes gene_type:complete